MVTCRPTWCCMEKELRVFYILTQTVLYLERWDRKFSVHVVEPNVSQ